MNTLFLNACYRKKTAHIPVWYMRQAGRYLPQYRKLKEKYTILEICTSPQLAAQVALQPVDILGVDAAILFADIMIPLLGIGVELEIVENLGPVIAHPIALEKDIKKLRQLEPTQDIPYLLETIAILRRELKNKVPLIGFSAAPFTLASYLIEGKPTRDFIKTKALMYTNTKAWRLLMETLCSLIRTYLQAQIKAGVQAVQLFDSWVGALSEEDYKEFVLPYTRKIFESLHNPATPLIHFGTNTAGLLSSFASVSCDVVSVDWRIPIAKAWEKIEFAKAIQGNLDPALLLSDFFLIKKRVDYLFASLPQRNGYIFNLGHGVLPQTPVATIQRLTAYVHEK